MAARKLRRKSSAAAGKGKTPHSWRTSVFGLIGVALAFLILFMLVSTSILIRQTQRALKEADQQTLSVIGDSLQNSLNLTTAQVKDLLRTVYSQENLESPVASLRLAAQNTVSNDITSKLSFSSNMSCMFVINTRNGMTISDYNPRIDNAVNTVSALRDYLKTEEPVGSVMSDDTWSLMMLNDIPVLYKGYRYTTMWWEPCVRSAAMGICSMGSTWPRWACPLSGMTAWWSSPTGRTGAGKWIIPTAWCCPAAGTGWCCPSMT